MISELPCRHRDAPVSPGVHRCTSPRLIGLKLVTAAMCSVCHYRDHEPAGDRRDLPTHLLPCLRRGRAVAADAGEGVVHECLHPDHLRTTDRHCAGCPDYLFPAITPETPAAAVQEMLDLPPRPQQPGWWEWPNVQEAIRRAADRAIAAIPPYPGGYQGRGIVIVGGGKYFASAYVSIRILRHVGCQLPIELWHLSGEMSSVMRQALAPYGVSCVDADEAARQRPFRFLHGHWWKGWQLKPYALLHSSFREVLLLDADCYPTRNPEYLFDWAPYQQCGATFWPDLQTSEWLLAPHRWAVFGTEPGWLALESGQLLVNKETCWPQLQLTLWYNAHADFVYNIVWGDKDTFNIAWRRLDSSYSMPRTIADWDTHTILQYGPDGSVLFQHRCQDKFRLGSCRFASTFQSTPVNQYNPRLMHEDLCFAFLDHLRQLALPGVDGECFS